MVGAPRSGLETSLEESRPLQFVHGLPFRLSNRVQIHLGGLPILVTENPLNGTDRHTKIVKDRSRQVPKGMIAKISDFSIVHSVVIKLFRSLYGPLTQRLVFPAPIGVPEIPMAFRDLWIQTGVMRISKSFWIIGTSRGSRLPPFRLRVQRVTTFLSKSMSSQVKPVDFTDPRGGQHDGPKVLLGFRIGRPL